MNLRWQSFRYYSPEIDGEVERVSVAGPEGREFYKNIPVSEGRTYREARQNAAQDIADAIDQGAEPGEVQ